MTVQELIEALQLLNRPDDEIGYEVGTNHVDLLIGEDPDSGESVYITKPKWL